MTPENQHLEYNREPTNRSEVPRNKVLMRIFRDMDMVKYLGSGIPRILRCYSRDNFRFTENFIRMTFPVPGSHNQSDIKVSAKTPEKTPGKILNAFLEDPGRTLADVAGLIGKSSSAVERAAVKLQTEGRLKRVGLAKGGHWEVLL